ncbi:MAG: hypothetical protein OQK76_11655, partial [Gammaproteobacteria bacterium]|nr:hypothetical protein [Gammaproteobacteria bacterium]
MKFWKLASTATVLILSTSANATIIEANWQSVGDITRDTVSGLNWLDLTETLGMSRIAVEDQLVAGGQFEGFRYATADEVVGLWANWGVNLGLGADMTITGAIDPGIQAGASYLGNTTVGTYSYLPVGAFGITFDSDINWSYRM